MWLLDASAKTNIPSMNLFYHCINRQYMDKQAFYAVLQIHEKEGHSGEERFHCLHIVLHLYCHFRPVLGHFRTGL